MGKRKFTKEEDAQLLDLYNSGLQNQWTKIAQVLGTRSARQCRERYINYLSPDVHKKKWTPDEDNLLIQKVGEYGCRWAKLVQFFPGRAEIHLKNRWG